MSFRTQPHALKTLRSVVQDV